MMPIAMTIAGVDPGGGAGVAADLKTFAALGVHGTCIITSVTAQNTKGVLNSCDIPVEFIKEQFEAVVSDIRIDCAKTGMLSSPEIVKAVARLVKKQDFPLVVDPVMAAEAGGELLKDEALGVMVDELLPVATVVTPNIFEAGRLSGIKIRDVNDAKKAALKIHELGAKKVIVTGGHLAGTDVLYSDGEFTYIVGELKAGGTHGSGCTHSAAITAQLARGIPLVEAAQRAKKFVEQAIISSVKIGSGVAPVNQLGRIIGDAQRYSVIKNVEEAAGLVKNNAGFTELIPEVGCNIAMGIQNATQVSDVAAISGRIVRLKGAPHAVGCIAFGASSHVARIVLAAMQIDDSRRAAMNIRYSQEALVACREIGFNVWSFERDEEPQGVSTMEWGVGDVIRKAGIVPDVIFDTGGTGKEAMIRLLGKDAVEVARMSLRVMNAMIR